MGKKGGWFSAVRKAIRPSDSNQKKKDKRSYKSNPKKSWPGDQKSLDTDLSRTEAAFTNPSQLHPPVKETKLKEPENDHRKQAYPVDYSKAEAAAEVTSSPSTSRFLGKSKEDIAAIKIQMAYRGYLARRALQVLQKQRRVLKGQRRLKSLMQGQSVKRQAASTLRCMHTFARVQTQVRARRIRMAEENKALQRLLLQKQEKETNNQRSNWDLSTKSKEQVEARLRSKKEAAERRERALAYAHTCQQTWRNSLKSENPTFMNPTNPHWEWSWLERWSAVRPWSMTNRESVGDMGRQISHGSPSKAPSSVSGGRLRSTNSKGSMDDNSTKSEQNQRSLSVHVDENPASSTPRSHKGSTKSTKSRSPLSNPGPSPSRSGKKSTLDTGSRVGSTKKRLPFSGSPSSGDRTSSCPPKRDSNTAR